MTVLFLVAGLVALGFSAFFSGSETGLYCMNRLRVRLDAEQGDRRARRLVPLLDRMQDALTTMLVGTNIANYFLTICVANLLAAWSGLPESSRDLYTTLVATPVVFVFGEVVPKIVYQRSPDPWMRAGSLLAAGSSVLLRLPVRALNAVARPIVRYLDPKGLSVGADPRRRMALLLQDAIATDDQSGEHSELVDRVLGLSSVALHQVMVPRNRVVAIRADADRRECLSIIGRHPHTRFPVYDRNPRRIIGHVVAHTLLADDTWQTVADRLRPVISMSAHESVASAILRLQAKRQTLAVVVDRHGALLGLITLKDLLEELTGELHAW
jgi:CBS domain containing-hemolysin-like protein